MAQTAVAAPDFADVYQQHLLGVWRYVRSHIPDYHEAQDVTSDVFTRAWRSWPGFDSRRGPVGAWLFRIAQRGVADWQRKHLANKVPAPVATHELEELLARDGNSPEAAVLQREVLQQLGHALGVLTERERDCLALRFAAGLKMAEVAQVLGVSTGAAKMIISRALSRIADRLAQGSRQQTAAPLLLLDDLVDEVLERGNATMSRSELESLVMHLATLHQPSLPADLPGRVKYCIQCASSSAVSRRPRSLLAYTPLSWVTLAPICLACTIPILFAPLAALGVSLGVGVGFHALSLVTAPFVFLLLWRHFRRHRDHLVLWIGGAGALLLIGHLTAHLFDVREYWVLAITNQLGVPLLILGSLLDLRAMRRWMSEQRKRMLFPGLPQGATA